jgi:hypothetical protein
MGIQKLVSAALIGVIAAAATGRPPQLVREVQIAQLKLLKDSQSSKWDRAMLLPIRKSEKQPLGVSKIRRLDGMGPL